jgi:hypothetical protein
LKQSLPIIGLVGVFLVLATLYSAAIPLGEGPDEPGHAGYAFFLARAGRQPIQRLEAQQTDVPGEGHQPPLAYALAAPLALWLPREERQAETIGNPRFTWSGGAELNAISHGSREYPPWQGAVLAWQLMRLVSVALGAATVYFTYLAAGALEKRLEIRGSRLGAYQSQVPLLAAGLVAFNPQFLFVSALVTNDALLTTLSAAMLWLVLRYGAKPRKQVGGALAIGAMLGLALLTKQSALVLAPVALIGVASRQRGGMLRRSAVAILLVLATAGLIAGWWYMRNQRLYGDLLGLAAFRGEFATQPFEIGSLLAWAAALAQLHDSFWARFGWMNVAPPDWVLWPIGAIELVAVGGLVWALLRSGATGRRAFVRVIWPLVLLLALAFAWIVSFAITAGLVAWQGRLLFPALPAIAILLARGLSVVGSQWSVALEGLAHCHAPRTTDYRLRAIALVLTLCPLLALALWIPDNVIAPAYPRQTLPEALAQERIGTPLTIRFRRRGERSIALRGWRLDGQARPGAALDLTLIWFVSSRQMHDWVVFVQLIDQQGSVAAAAEQEPRGGAFPTSQWNSGDWIEDRHQLALPANLAAGSYTLRMGLHDPGQDNRRAGVYKPGDQLIGDALDLGPVEVGDS